MCTRARLRHPLFIAQPEILWIRRGGARLMPSLLAANNNYGIVCVCGCFPHDADNLKRQPNNNLRNFQWKIDNILCAFLYFSYRPYYAKMRSLYLYLHTLIWINYNNKKNIDNRTYQQTQISPILYFNLFVLWCLLWYLSSQYTFYIYDLWYLYFYNISSIIENMSEYSAAFVIANIFWK